MLRYGRNGVFFVRVFCYLEYNKIVNCSIKCSSRMVCVPAGLKLPEKIGTSLRTRRLVPEKNPKRHKLLQLGSKPVTL